MQRRAGYRRRAQPGEREATSNIGFVLGVLDDPAVHAPYELFAAVVVNLVATGLKISDRTREACGAENCTAFNQGI
jgi:hypothetical protein